MSKKFLCPNCNKEVPDNERAAYGRHEDCYVATASGLLSNAARSMEAKAARLAHGRRKKATIKEEDVQL